MAKLVWDQTGEHYFETGVDHGVLFSQKSDGTYDVGVAWNGLVSVEESPSGAEPTAIYADNIKYLNIYSAEEYGATITAYTYPDEWEKHDGLSSIGKGAVIGQQARRAFAFVYRTRIGNEVVGDSLGYKIHIVYNATASPSGRTNQTVNDTPEPNEMAWEISTVPLSVGATAPDGSEYRPTSTLVLDSREVDPDKLKEIEETLFGNDTDEPTLLLPKDVLDLLAA